jgi:hypothetical protein
VAIGSVAFTFWMWSSQRFAPPPVRFTSGPTVVGLMVFAVAYVSIGWLLAGRKSRNVVGWAFLGMGLATALEMPAGVLVAAAHEVLRPVPTGTLLWAWLSSSAHVPVVAALAITAFTLFPDGRPLSRRWILPAVMAVMGALLVALAAALSPEGLIWYPSLPNPFALPSPWAPLIVALSATGALLLISGLVLAAASVVIRYRRSDEIGRAQLRWIVSALVLMVATGVPFLALRYAMGTSVAIGSAIVLALTLASILLPIAAAVAIMRYRLFEIDLIINRTLVYVPLVAFLGGLFTASITLSQRLFMGLTGNTSDFAIVFTTLIVASAITPVRHGLETLVDRHVKPSRHVEATPPTPAASTVPDVSPVLAAAGFIADAGPARQGSQGPDLIALIGHLNERIEELEGRLAQDEERFAGH